MQNVKKPLTHTECVSSHKTIQKLINSAICILVAIICRNIDLFFAGFILVGIISAIVTIVNRIKLETKHYYIYVDTVVNKSKNNKKVYLKNTMHSLSAKKNQTNSEIGEKYYLVLLEDTKTIIGGFSESEYKIDKSLLENSINIYDCENFQKETITHQFCVNHFRITIIEYLFFILYMSFFTWLILVAIWSQSFVLMIMCSFFVIPVAIPATNRFLDCKKNKKWRILFLH